MRLRVGLDKLPLLLLFGALLGLFVLGPLGSVFADVREPDDSPNGWMNRPD